MSNSGVLNVYNESDKNLLRYHIGLIKSRQFNGLSSTVRGALKKHGLARYTKGKNGNFRLTPRGEQLLSEVLAEEEK